MGVKEKYRLLELLSLVIPTSSIIRLTQQRLFLPVYHTIQGNYSLSHIHHLYPPKTKKQFEKDLDFLLKNYNPISLEELHQSVIEEKILAKNSFHLTFDDGLREIYEFALPILQKKGIPATVFLNSDFVDNQDLFFRYKASLLIEKIITNPPTPTTEQMVKNLLPKNKNIQQAILNITFQDRHVLDQIANVLELDFDDFLKTQQPYLTSAQIQSLQKDGFTFGAHSVNHPKYSDLSLEEQIQQTKESINFVQEKFQSNLKTFAFPFHDINVKDDFFQNITNENIVDLTFGSAIFSKRKRKTHLQRFPMEGNMLNAKALFIFKSLYYFMKKKQTH